MESAARSNGPALAPRLLWLALLGLVPAVLSVKWAELAWAAAAWDLGLVIAATLDFFLATRAAAITARRSVEPVLSAGIKNKIVVHLASAPGAHGRLVGELRDTPGPGPEALGARASFDFEGQTDVVWQLLPKLRGDLAFGDLHLRLLGPLGLCARQLTVPAARLSPVWIQ